MSVKEQLVESLRFKAGYDMFSACEIADNFLAEFRASGESCRTVRVMALGKCVQAFELRRANP